MEYTPAHYLHQFLSKAFLAKIADNVEGRVGWGQIFGVEPRSREFYGNIHIMEMLCERIVQLIAEEPQVRDSTRRRYLEYAFEIKKVFSSAFFGSQWSQIRSMFTPHAIELLEQIEDFLSPRCGLREIPADDIVKLREKFSQLYEDVRVVSISPELKKILLFQIQQILNVLARYDIVGTQGLSDSLRAMVGALWLSGISVEEEKNKGIYEKIKGVMEECKYWIRSSGEAVDGFAAIAGEDFSDLPLLGS